VILIMYLTLAAGTALARRPWCDEAWFASPALNLMRQGTMGTSIFETANGSADLSVHTYWQPPLYFLMEVPWFTVWGFSLFTERALSIVWGIVLILATHSLIRALTQNEQAGRIAALVTALDPVCLQIAGGGRMDMMSTALGFGGLAVYMAWRERRFRVALLASNTLVAGSGLTHPNGILALAGLVVLILIYNRDRIRLLEVGTALLPYLIGGAGWGLYIAQNPAAFVTQFSGNMAGRLSGLSSILAALQHELTERYLVGYNLFGASILDRVVIIIPIMYLTAFFALLISRRCRANHVLLLLTALYFTLMTVVIGHKASFYMAAIIPLWAGGVAVWLAGAGRSTRAGLIVLMALIALELVSSVNQVIAYARDLGNYTQATAYLSAQPPGMIMGSAELAFQLGFTSRLTDDVYLGFNTGKQPQMIVIEDRYRRWLAQFQVNSPEVYDYAQRMLGNQYEMVYSNAVYQIYRHR
jgi:4-amino-4-deoxy-L-arabinose transferase-like glycosyltransferase